MRSVPPIPKYREIIREYRGIPMLRPLLASLLLTTVSLAPVQAGLRLFDDGTHTKQVLAEGGDVYILKESGHIWRWRQGQFQQLDNGSGTRMVATDQGHLFVLKDSGHIWHNDGARWNQIDDGSGTRQITASGGRLFSLKDSGHIWMWTRGQWTRIDDGIGTRKIHAGGDKLWILKENNHTWQYDASRGQFRQLSRGNVSHTQDIVGDERDAFVLKGNGKLYRWRSGKFASIGWKDGHRSLAVDQDAINVLNDRGTVYRWSRSYGTWTEMKVPRGAKQIASAWGRVFVLSAEGQIYSWEQAPRSAVSSKFDQLHGE